MHGVLAHFWGWGTHYLNKARGSAQVTEPLAVSLVILKSLPLPPLPLSRAIFKDGSVAKIPHKIRMMGK